MPESIMGRPLVNRRHRRGRTRSHLPLAPLPLPLPCSAGTDYLAPAAPAAYSTPLAAQKTPPPGLAELQVGPGGCRGGGTVTWYRHMVPDGFSGGRGHELTHACACLPACRATTASSACMPRPRRMGATWRRRPRRPTQTPPTPPSSPPTLAACPRQRRRCCTSTRWRCEEAAGAMRGSGACLGAGGSKRLPD